MWFGKSWTRDSQNDPVYLQFRSKKFSTIHLLALLFNQDRVLAGKTILSKTPITYIKRLLLKPELKKETN